MFRSEKSFSMYILLMYSLIAFSSENKTTITIFALTNFNDHQSLSVLGSQRIAIQEINNEANLLSNYTLNLTVFDLHDDIQTTIIAALDIIQYKTTSKQIYYPICLGTPYSWQSTTTASILGAFNMGQISSSSTSIVLSDASKYPYFYRTVPSDSLQAAGVITLCHEFNWTKIVVVYVNNAYGLHLSLGIQELAQTNGIEVTLISVSDESDVTYTHAANQIKDLEIYIIILITYSTATLFKDFNDSGIVGYPYFYVGTDGWFDEITIERWNVQKETQGFIGTLPWQPDSLPLNEYTNDIIPVVNNSIVKWSNLKTSWQYYYSNGYKSLSRPGMWAIYGYDAVYTIADSIQSAINKFNDEFIELVKNNANNNTLIEFLNDYIVNDIDFIGASGDVTFNKIGDRSNGLYSFGNLLDNGTINYFGYFYENKW